MIHPNYNLTALMNIPSSADLRRAINIQEKIESLQQEFNLTITNINPFQLMFDGFHYQYKGNKPLMIWGTVAPIMVMEMPRTAKLAQRTM